MSQGSQAWREEHASVAGRPVRLLRRGQGEPLLVLHRDNGYSEGQRFFDLLAERFSIYLPSLPGYHGSNTREWAWLWSVRDLAVVLRQLLEHLGLERIWVVGLGFGGWLAAEMATTCEHRFNGMVLVAPMGIQPQAGEIYDQFLVSSEVYAQRGFHDQAKFDDTYGSLPEYDQLERWETDREMTSRIGWKPYMFNRSLPKLLQAVHTPALILWGRDDAVVPLECGRLYADALPNARLEVIDDCGHVADIERADQVARLCFDFAEQAAAAR